MSKAKLEAARELIREKKYAEARAILRTISSDPTAARWLAKLDEIAPKPSSRPHYARSFAIGCALGLVLLLAGVIVIVVFMMNARQQETTQLAVAPDILPNVSPFPQATTLPVVACVENNPVWFADAKNLITQFLDTAEVATSTSRMSLSSVIIEMQRTYREYQRIENPACADEFNQWIERGMAQAIDGFNSFMADSEFVSSFQLEDAAQSFYNSTLAGIGILTDHRLFNAAVFIWGGTSPNEATATAMRFTATPTATETPAGKAHP